MENGSDGGKQGRYGLSMSRRTRKPAAVAARASPDGNGEQGTAGDDAHRPSLKDLLKEGSGGEGAGSAATAVEAKVNEEAAGRGEEKPGLPAGGGGSAPAQRLGQEQKHLQMVKVSGSGTGGMVSRCVRVLNHLVKTRSGSRKKKKTVVGLLK